MFHQILASTVLCYVLGRHNSKMTNKFNNRPINRPINSTFHHSKFINH